MGLLYDSLNQIYQVVDYDADGQPIERAILGGAGVSTPDDDDDRQQRSALFTQLKQDYALLVDTTQNVTQAQYRAILARVLRCLWFFLQIAMRRGL